MIRQIIKNIIIFSLLILGQTAFSETVQSGPIFTISGTGDLGGVADITLCLDGNGPLSCQHFTVTNTNLSITINTPRHTYPAVGIKSNSPAFKINPANCTVISNGYCLFSANSRTPTTILVTTTAVYLTATPSTDTEANVVYSQANLASGGTPPYVYSVSTGTLPAGTTLNTSTGTVSGTPTTAGAFSYTIKVTDTDGLMATALTSGTMTSGVNLTATPSTHTEVGVAYSQTNVASGGTLPYVYSVSAGTLPAGTTLNTSTGTVSGTPTTPAGFSYTIMVTDNEGATAIALTGGSMYTQLGLSGTASTHTEVGVAYAQTNDASGGTGFYTYSLSSGTLPVGTTLNTVSGTVSGTPTTSGSINYTIQVVDTGGGVQTATTSGTMHTQLVLTGTASTNTQVGVAYSQTNVASGGTGSYTYSLSSGTLPAGTTLNTGTGTVSGTPTTSGSINYTIQVADTGGGVQTATTSGTMSLGNQTISFTSTAPSSPGPGDTYTPTATSTSGLIVSITIDGASGGVCSINSGLVTFNSFGTCYIDADQAGNANYNPAAQVQQIITVAPLMPLSSQSYDVITEALSSTTSNDAAISPDQITSISCPSTSFCMAVDTEGTAFRYDGTKWDSVDKIDTGHVFKSVSCSNSSNCVAIDTSGYAFTYNGTWSTGSQLETNGELVSVSCPASSFCMVVDNNANSFAYNGTTWSRAEPVGIAPNLTAVSCTNNAECIAVDAQGNGSYYNGSVWTAYSANPISTHGLNSISCPPNSDSFCMAVDSDGSAFSYNGTIWAPQYSGAIHTKPLISVSCLGTAFCMAVDSDGGALRYNGVTWSSVFDMDEQPHSITSLSCPTSALCLVVDKEGNALKYNASVSNINGALRNSTDTDYVVSQTHP